jgi:RNA polymerase sigma-70 factor (ECF subfamily)
MMPTLTSRTGPGALDGLLADEASFRAWYDATLPRVYRYLFHRCGRDRELAEELTQQTFVDAVRTQAGASTDDPVSWVIGIARHRLADYFRTLERRERGYRRWISLARPPVVTWLGERTANDALVEAVSALPAAQRAAIVLRYLDDLPVREVARLLGRSEGAVESLLSRGRETLRRTLEDEA